MSMMESVAYLRGLTEGLELDATTKEGKLLLAIVDVLEEMASSLKDVEEICDELDEMVDILDEDLSDLEDDVYGDEDEDEDEDEDDEEVDGEIYEVTCPACDNMIYLDEECLLCGEISCPECGQKLEFDMTGCDCDCDDHHCDCGCDCHE